MATTCNVCQRPFSFFERITQWNRERCPSCIQSTHHLIEQWKTAIYQEFGRQGITSQKEYAIVQQIESAPPDARAALYPFLKYYRKLSEIQWGNVQPIFISSLHLTTDEHAYFNVPTTFIKPLKTTQYIPGDLIGTDKNLLFVSHTGANSNTMEWGNIASIKDDAQSIRIEMKKGKGGAFQVKDPLYVKVFCDMLTKRWNKRLIIQRELAGSRNIPEYIRLQVLEKYRHSCVLCGASGFANGVGLEMDHVIPFSKGGPSTLNNLQPLCGPCNKKKSNKL